MSIVEIIQQYTTTYTIKQYGNRSFRIAYKRAGDKREMHIDKIYDTVEDAKAFIAACKNMDYAISLIK